MSYSQERQLMKMVHDEMGQFYDVVTEKEFKEVQDKFPNSRLVLYKVLQIILITDLANNLYTRQTVY